METQRLNVRVAGRTHVFDADAELGRLHLRLDEHGWTAVDAGLEGGLFLHGCRVASLPVDPDRSVTVHIGEDGPEVLLEVEPAPLPVTVAVQRPRPPIALAVDHVGFATDGRTLLNGITFALPPSSLTAVIGPSGAGKSTLLRVLTGQAKPSYGHVRWRGTDVHADHEALRSRIGLVPQEEILHPQLTVATSLEYAAELRLPADTTLAQRTIRVEQVMDRMGIARQADQRIGAQLSGGQRKRVSIATELLTAPPLLFLDEPTSGLDPGLDRSVMQELRGLADEDRVVVVVTHSVLGLDVCDNLVVLARGGALAYVGPPEEVLDHFDCEDFPELFDLLEARQVPAYVPSDGLFANETRRRGGTGVPPPQPGSQLRTLVRRNLAVLLADRLHLALLVALPLVLAGLARLVQGDAGLSMWHTRNRAGQLIGTEPSQRLTILVIAAVLMGIAMTVRELVGERAVFRREYAVGLSPGVYYASKALVLGTACFGQGLVVAWIALAGMPGVDRGGVRGWGWWEIALPVALLAAVTALIGLVVSARVRALEHTMPALVAVVMAQLVLSSAIVRMAGRPVLDQVSWLSPSRWAYAAGASSVRLGRAHQFDPTTHDDPLFHATGGQWLLDVSILVVLGAVVVALGVRAVRRSAA
ncbi:ATP-binding cassette domain-containing protein [Nocardioides montaniterrae]